MSEKHFPLRSSCSKVGNAIQQINHCPADTFSSKCTALYPPDLFTGWHYPSFKQWEPKTGNLVLQSECTERKASWFESRLMSCWMCQILTEPSVGLIVSNVRPLEESTNSPLINSWWGICMVMWFTSMSTLIKRLKSTHWILMKLTRKHTPDQMLGFDHGKFNPFTL